jgi:hypothetical protein
MRNLVAVHWAPACAVALLVFSTPVASSEQGPFKYEQAWALNGPCCGDSGHDIAVESDGSFFIVGNYGTLDLDRDGRADLTSEGGHDAIILKGRPAGDLAWVRAPRSPAMSFARLTVASDRRGGAYLAGGFNDSMQFKSGERIVSRGSTDGLLVRYSADGDPLWARAIGGDRFDVLADASVDAAGHIYVTGTIQGAVDLDSDGRADAKITAENGLVVASYDASGKLRWAQVAVSKYDVTGAAIVVSADGAARVAGHYSGGDVDLDADGRVDLPAPRVEGAPFVAHFDSGGRLSSAIALPGSGDNRIGNLAHAANGDLVASGYTKGSVDLNGDGRADVVNSDNRATPYVARFDRKGTLLWVRAFSQKERVAILDLATSEDRIAVSGLYEAHLDLDQDGRPDAAADPGGKSEGFVAILGNDGAIRQVLAITGPGHDQPRGVAFAPDGQSLSLTGFVRLTADFDGDGVPEGGVRCDNDGDIVWARYVLQTR